MAQAFRSTRVVTPQGLAPATLVVENKRIAEVRGWDDVAAVDSLRGRAWLQMLSDRFRY